MDINSYLDPLIADMEKLWEGIHIKVNKKNIKVRAAISFVLRDVPAARKIGGFVGHRGRRSCTECFKEFPTQQFGDYPDYSGFIKSEWEPRLHAVHVWYAKQQKKANTESQRKEIESDFGARYSLLYELQYYNTISSLVIDPMHCLLLGIAKKFFKVWTLSNIVLPEHYTTIQNKVDSFKCPPDIGRIPYKIASKFSGLKADQWKSWSLHFSLYSLKGILPNEDYNCWHKFVIVSYKLFFKKISLSELDEIDHIIEEFCTLFFTTIWKK